MVRLVRWRRWGLALTVLATLGGLTVAGRLDHSSVAYWDAPKPLGGPAIVRGHRLGAPQDRVGFLQDQQKSRPIHLLDLLDPASAYPAGEQGSWWRPTRLQAGRGCYGLQIDGVGFNEVLVVEFG